MLTSLCVFFSPKDAVSFCGIIFPTKHRGAGAQFPGSGIREEKLYDELLLRWSGVQAVWGGGLTKWHQRVGWVVGLLRRRSASLRAVRPYFLGVHSASLLYARHGSRGPPPTRRSKHSTAADMRGVGLLKHWHFPVTAGLEGMVAADCCWCCLSFSRAEYRK